MNKKLLALTMTLASGTVLGAVDFAEWDENANNSISQEEWNAGLEEDGLFQDLDSDGDNQISESEFNDGLAGVESEDTSGSVAVSEQEYDYDAWDADGDGLLSQTEASEGLYDTYDEDNDAVIEEPEFDDFGDDMGDAGLFDV